MRVKIVVSVVIVASLTTYGLLAAGFLNFFSTAVDPYLDPRVTLTGQTYEQVACEDIYVWYWPWPTGQRQTVKATLVFLNDGPTNARVIVAFTADGRRLSPPEQVYLTVGDGEVRTFQFQLDDCASHQYLAQIEDVEPG